MFFQNYVNNHKIRKKIVKNFDFDFFYFLLKFDIYHEIINENEIQIVNIIRFKIIDKLHKIINKMKINEKYFKTFVTMNIKSIKFNDNFIFFTSILSSIDFKSKQKFKFFYYNVDFANLQKFVIFFCHYSLLFIQVLVFLLCDIHYKL